MQLAQHGTGNGLLPRSGGEYTKGSESQMERPLKKFAVVGMGILGKRHSNAQIQNPKAELVAVCDLYEAQMQEFVAAHPSVKMYTDARKMFQECDVDVAIIATQDPYHKDPLLAAIDAGKLILIHDGRQVKIARAVNSLTTTLLDHGAIFQKIKALEVVDRVDADFRATIEDTFIGKVLNTYDNRMLLVTAGRSYFHTLETAGLLIEDKSSLDIDTEAVRDYLGAAGDELGDEELRHADTGSHVFLVGKFTIADAIEDVTIRITV